VQPYRRALWISFFESGHYPGNLAPGIVDEHPQLDIERSRSVPTWSCRPDPPVLTRIRGLSRIA